MLTAFSKAQQISGVVKDNKGKPLRGASVTLFNATNKLVVKISVTNKEGNYLIKDIAQGTYYISVSSVGFEEKKSATFNLVDKDIILPEIMIEKTAKQLEGVTVTSRKPPVEVKADKTIVNVEGSINAQGSDAFELLRKSPGVTVDKDDNISLSGKNGVIIYIDGKPSPLSGKDLADFLRSLNSNQIEAIELITNPSAKYDAAGNAGIINIRLKKNKAFGTNGSINAGYGIGVYGKYNTSINLNHRNNKINLFGNYSFNNNTNENNMYLYRSVLDTLFNQSGTMTNKGTSNNFKLGMDYFINKKNTIGFMATGNFRTGSLDNYSNTPISYIPTNTGYRLLIADNTSNVSRQNTNLNINYRYIDTTGKELNIDADYGFFNIKNNQMQPNYYYDFAGTTEQERRVYNMISPTKITLTTLKADYEQPFAKGKLSFGGKFSYVQTANDFERYNVYTSGKILDTLRSNDFNYKENINAVYVNYNKQLKGINLQVGIRVENTNATGNSLGFTQIGGGYVVYDSTFKRNYTNLFPSAAITFNKNPLSQWSISYSRRIDRPAYQDLNPFEFKLDEYTFQKGNTQLIPQYTNSFSLTHSYQYKLTTTLNYSHVSDVFTQLIDTAEKSKSFMTKKNLAEQDIVSLNISYPFQYKWYSAFINVNINYAHYKANFGTGRTIDLDALAFNMYMQNSFKLGKGYTAELSGWFNTPGIWQGTFKSKAMGSIDIGMQKQILKGKGNIKLSVSDVLYTMKWGGTSNFAGQTLKAHGNWESRQFKINFSYRFGKLTVKSARQRKTGSEEESKRVQSEGNSFGQ
ncbi:MAG: TonB-dependent receptor [Chitinophagaceae bacterium]|nr:TonB-dependent receptor [Chitinophagaceae bacterium]MCW5904780.1 TonB-dependent receptor [Chitinophagaceae bacterium]